MTNYKVIKQIRVGDTIFEPGDVVPETQDRDWVMLVRLKLVEPSQEKTTAASAQPTIPLTNQEVSVTDKSKPIIKEEEKGWIKVYVDGEQIGKATRDMSEAKKIAKEWQEANK
jgi:hypothetical protein